jgi:putative transposase
VPQVSPLLRDLGLCFHSALRMFVDHRQQREPILFSAFMPKDLHRYYGAGDLHFLTFSCYQRYPFLASARDRDLFLHVLEAMRRRYRFVVLGYVVMPEHVHLLLSEPQRATVSTFVQAVKLGFFRRRFGSGRTPRQPTLWPAAGRVWQARFYDFNVWTERKRIQKLRYMHRNPVARRLVESPEQWRWSSFRSYCYGEPGLVRINHTEILVMKMGRRPA